MTATHTPRFVHLRLHSEYSILDGIVQLDQAIARAAADGMPALGMSDLANLFGMVKFYKGARGRGVKPIIGVDAWITNEAERDKPFRVLLICRNRAGYGQLCELLTRAYLENKYRGRAEMRRAWFDDGAASGLVCLSGALAGDVGQALANGNAELARQLAGEWARRFPGAYYIELQRAGHAGTEGYIRAAVELAAALELPVVATHPVQFLKPEDFKAHEARVCIAQGYVLADKRRPREFTPEQYFKSQDEMCALFADLPEALENAVEIARRCSLTVELGKNFLPLFPTPEGMTLDDFLVAEAKAGLEVRLKELYPDEAERERQRPTYEARLAFETDTIIQMGFPGYFLIVADFINWAKHNGVPVGPGRGSGAGSLVAYSLRITDLDPLAYALLFERFLNPERVSMPDFDIDFCQDRRDEVIRYVQRRYGHDQVAQIITFGTLQARGVLRDVGRVLQMPYGQVDKLTKLVPQNPTAPVTLAKAIEGEPKLQAARDEDPVVARAFTIAQKLEGLNRHASTHAAGIVIGDRPLHELVPLYRDPKSDMPVTQFNMKWVEPAGLVKFDFLGLKTLTVLDVAVKLLRERDVHIDLAHLPLDDADTYAMLTRGDVVGVFQVESQGMRRALLDMRPDRFEDIIALVALYRPGPMANIPT
ncbi:MAG TPA: DNA polymerase III subunit alpha, partial [Rhodocyclaceae bacterium]|nr:DNA polymerase III subunit alpha [Rhodocyclaceae bacterium]